MGTDVQVVIDAIHTILDWSQDNPGHFTDDMVRELTNVKMALEKEADSTGLEPSNTQPSDPPTEPSAV